MAERWDFQNNRPSKIYDLEPSRPPTRMLLWLALAFLAGGLAILAYLEVNL